MIKKNYLIILVFLVIILILGGAIFYLEKIKKEKPILITVTDKSDYINSDKLKIKIQNSSKNKICFSSCYPYLLEVKNGDWKNYFDNSFCSEENINKFCLEPFQLKAYQIDLASLFDIKQGTHRIVLPACVNCQENQQFTENKRFYSNEFFIK